MTFKWMPAWRVSMHRVGWLPFVVTGLATFILIAVLSNSESEAFTVVRAVGMFLPAIAGMHAAFLLSPEDEHPLELILTTPRPTMWLLAERWLVLIAGYVGLGILLNIGQLAIFDIDETLILLIVRWLPPLLWFVSLGMFLTILTRQGIFGALMVLLMWAGTFLAGDGLTASCRVLLPVHAYLQPNAIGITATMYNYNRWALLCMAGGLLALSAGMLHNEERLLGIGKRRLVDTTLFRENPASILWLIIGLTLTAFTHNHWLAVIAVWIAPLFLLRFLSINATETGNVLTLFGLAGVTFFLWRDSLLLSGGCAALFSVQFSFFYLLPIFVAVWLSSRVQTGFITTLILPMCWVIMDTLNTVFSLSMTTVGSVAYSQISNLPLLQVMAITGMGGVTFLIAWFASVVNWVWAEGFVWHKIKQGVLVFAGILTLIYLGGWARLNLLPPPHATLPVTTFSLPEAFELFNPELLHPDNREQLRQATYAEQDLYLTRAQTEAEAGAKAIMWSEGEIVLLPEDEATFLDQAQNLAQTQEIYLLMGISIFPENFPQTLVQNKLVLVTPTGEIAWDYLKTIPVPGLELSQPGNGILPIYHAGNDTLFSGAICYDMDFPHLIQQAGQAGVDVMWVPANDIDERFSPWHAQMAIFRAIENGFTLVRQTNHGLTIATDYMGRELASVDYFTASDKTMRLTIPTQGVQTIYGMLGNWLTPVSALGLILILYRKKQS